MLEGFLLSGIQVSDFSASEIARSTIEAYLATEYRFGSEGSLTLRVGERNARLSAIYRGQAVGTAAIITAWNPLSEIRSNHENCLAQDRLIAELDRRSLIHKAGQGADPSGIWPAEDSRLVLGVDLTAAMQLGRQFDQNGIVWVKSDAVPTLVLLR
jgi:hypothetical protein